MFRTMHLTIQLPSRIFLEQTEVVSLNAESTRGCFGILPNRLDCVAALKPGILSYTTTENNEYHIAIDEGILVKEKNIVSISVKNALGDVPLSKLRKVVEEELMILDERESSLRKSLALLQGSIYGSLEQVKHARK